MTFFTIEDWVLCQNVSSWYENIPEITNAQSSMHNLYNRDSQLENKTHINEYTHDSMERADYSSTGLESSRGNNKAVYSSV